jgi:tetratricopeptide (TPR) repeat protein
VIGYLGRGGMGVVYRAVHLETAEHVAVKMVRSVDPRRIERLRREIRALARLVHPLIIRIIYSGESDLGPWYAMPILTGTTLMDHCGAMRGTEVEPDMGETLPASAFLGDFEEPSDEWWTASMGPRGAGVQASEGELDSEAVEALRIVSSLCSPLAYLHGEGLVHRDLKPDNILINERGAPVVVDFGLSGEFGGAVSRERLERRMGVVGTPAYMSPEQIRGDLVDARSDLYAVGCILYELLTGRPPHIADTVDGVFRGHLEEEVVPPSQVRGAPLPPAVDRLVVGLLEKDPLRRLWHADDLAARLDGILRGAGVDAVAPPEGFPDARPYLYRPGFVGRQAEVDQLGEVIEGLRGGRGAIMLTGGPAGAGKTRLALEVVKRLGQIGALVLVADADATTAEHPLGMLEPIFASIADFCRAGGREMTDEVLGQKRAMLTRFSPALDALPGAHQEAEAQDSIPRVLERARIVAQVWQLIASVVGKGPVALVLDELHHADPLTFELLVSVAGGDLAGSVPLLIFGTYRPEEAPPELERLLRTPRVRAVPLPPLDDEGVSAMVANMLGLAYPPPALVRFLTKRAGGNPFAVAEYLGAALESGLLSRDSAGRWVLDDNMGSNTLSQMGLPTSIGELIRRRMRALAPPLQELLAIASVAGGPIDALLTAAVVQRDVHRVQDQLGLLVQRELVVLVEGAYDLAHDQIRRAVADAVDGASTADIQARLCLAWASRRAEGGEVPLDRFAVRLRALGRTDEAAAVYLDAARRAVAIGALEVAAPCYQSYFELSSATGVARLVATREWVEGVLLPQGPTAALRVLDVAVPRARALGARMELSRLQLLRGRACRADGKPDAAVEAFEDAIYEGTGSVHAEVLVDARCRLCDALRALDRLDDAAAVVATAVLDSAPAGGPIHGVALGAQAGVLAARGDLTAAADLYERALGLHAAEADRDAEVRILVEAAALDCRFGHYDRARERLERAHSAVDALGDLRTAGWVLDRLGWLALHGGNVSEARALYGAAVDALRASGSTRTLVAARAELARAHAWSGELRLAAELLGAARAAAAADRGAPGALVRLRLAEVACTRGELALAQAQLREARAIAPARLGPELDVLTVRLRRMSEGAMFAVPAAMNLVAVARDLQDPGVLISAVVEAVPTLRDVARFEECLSLAREGLDLAAGIGHAFGEVRLLTELTTLARYRGRLQDLEQALATAQERASEIGDAVNLAHLACERGHLHLAAGDSVTGALGDARVRVERLDVMDTSETARRLTVLTRAVGRSGAGKPLVYGADLQDYPPAVRGLLAGRKTP